MTSAGTPLRRSARPGWYGSGSPTRARTSPSVLASWTAPSASASHSRGLAPDEGWAGTCRLTRTLAPGILSLARLSTSFRISAGRERMVLVACGQRFPDAGCSRFFRLTVRSLQRVRLNKLSVTIEARDNREILRAAGRFGTDTRSYPAAATELPDLGRFGWPPQSNRPRARRLGVCIGTAPRPRSVTPDNERHRGR
jgi:hypothetical protein